jgi:hypothetical protein
MMVMIAAPSVSRLQFYGARKMMMMMMIMIMWLPMLLQLLPFAESASKIPTVDHSHRGSDGSFFPFVLFVYFDNDDEMINDALYYGTST